MHIHAADAEVRKRTGICSSHMNAAGIAKRLCKGPRYRGRIGNIQIADLPVLLVAKCNGIVKLAARLDLRLIAAAVTVNNYRASRRP
ncbi:hypothetical protein D3C86_1520190 [compost metagenome]